MTLLHHAIDKGNTKIVKILLDNPNIDINKHSYLWKEGKTYHTEPSILIIIFINKTPLYFAVEKGNPDIIQLLLSNPKIYVNERSILRKYHPARCIYPNRKQII